MMRLLLFVFVFLSASSWAQPTNQLIILTTFTRESLQPVLDAFQQYYPDVSFSVLHRRETSGLHLLNQDNHDIDVVLSSSLSLFSTLEEQQRLLPLETLNFDSTSQQQRFMQHTINNVVIFGYSGLGLMWNQDYLDKHHLPRPERWEDLTAPEYFRHLVMSSPARSGTTHVMVENLLQRYGWKRGWQIILQIGGNLAAVSARSYGVSDSITRGLAGIGLTIDSHAFSRQKHFPYIGFTYQPHSPLLPGYVAAVRNTNQALHSVALIRFLLSEEVQKKLAQDTLNKYALNQTLSQPLDITPINLTQMQQRTILIKLLFEQIVNQQLLRLNQAWQLIHEVRSLPLLTMAETRQLNLAVKLASTPPITESQAEDPILLEALSLNRQDISTLHHINQWRQLMTSQLDQAIAICEQLIASKEHRQVHDEKA
ncbi:ABC transporter substrate-binding protein [Photobacterium sp. GSS17]|uniref:ABC transporter substrate-binding protein n=1 Tax=Photobacterium sp. GSS17 TaxID=3020715 RepID=UPI00235E67D8|nr:extracellular solute-binding protein [Photobacterium sp. GSS17]